MTTAEKAQQNSKAEPAGPGRLRRLGRRRMVAIVLAVVLLVAAGGVLIVGGGSDSKPAAVQAEPAPTGPPVLPAPAKEATGQGATYFAGYWLEALSWARTTLDGAALGDLALPSCRTCSDFRAQLESDRATGTRYEGGTFTFLSGEPVGVEDGRSALVNVTFTESELTVRDGAGKIVDSVPEHAALFQLDLRWTETGWKVATAKLGDIR